MCMEYSLHATPPPHYEMNIPVKSLAKASLSLHLRPRGIHYERAAVLGSKAQLWMLSACIIPRGVFSGKGMESFWRSAPAFSFVGQLGPFIFQSTRSIHITHPCNIHFQEPSRRVLTHAFRFNRVGFRSQIRAA